MWIASLSSGETIFEAEPAPGDISTWQKLLQRLREDNNGLKITQLRLQHRGRTIVAMPKCDGYVACYEAQKILNTSGQIVFQGIGSVIGDQVYMNWINESGTIWQDVRPLKGLKIHSTLS